MMRYLLMLATVSISVAGLLSPVYAVSVKIAVSPDGGEQVLQNPPLITWPRVGSDTGYTLEWRLPGGQVRQYTTQANWWLSAQAMPAGEHAWRVRSTAPAAGYSDWHRFRLAVDTNKFTVPDDDELLRRISAKARPRLLPVQKGDLRTWQVAVMDGRAKDVERLRRAVQQGILLPALVDASFPTISAGLLSAENVQLMNQARSLALAASKQLRAAALLWRVTGERAYLDEALRRGTQLAALDPAGPTAFERQDQAFREILWSLAFSFDLMERELQAEVRAHWRGAVLSRLDILFADLSRDNWRLNHAPLDSHGVTNTRYLITTAVLMHGESPRTAQILRAQLRRMFGAASPWGGYDGGFANGTAYAEYNLVSLIPMWDALQAATSVNLYRASWSRGFMDYLIGFLPPGQPTHNFGDGAEDQPFTATLRAYAKRLGSGRAAWYVANLIGEEDPITALTAPLPLPVDNQVQEAPTVTSMFMPSIGWVALHSDLADRQRTSVYFKASPFGAFNHSHADQNSFTVVASGRTLLSDSDKYDWYGSPLWRSWYRQTKAHNAVTFDGGQGQMTEGYGELLDASGNIAQFVPGKQIDYVEGDATAAYGVALSKAQRQLWYLRKENVLVVRDILASPLPRIFEWNMHALAPWQERGAITMVQRDDQSACLAEISNQGATFKRRNSFGTGGYHGYYSTGTAALSQEFLVVIDIGCRYGELRPVEQAGGWRLDIGKTTLLIPPN